MSTVDIIVAGHLCLDLIPTFDVRDDDLSDMLIPGKLVHVGPAVTATGGAVSNTGQALHRLGLATQLMGKVGDDMFGRAILDAIRRQDERLAETVIVSPGEASSYTLVINPPGVDRIFFHCPGANDTFCAADVDLSRLAGARLFHFGYPPLMRRMFLDNGAELAGLLRQVKAAGLTTSLDMARPDPNSEAGRVDWAALLANVLPYVDLFVPSVDEILFMLDRPRFETLIAGGDLNAHIDGALLAELAGQLLELGAAVVLLKLGDQGAYLRTTANSGRLANLGAIDLPAGWLNRELLAPVFAAKVAGTTGAGDCTIAGFLAGVVKGLSIEDTLRAAVAVGACNVESADSVSGIPAWEMVQARLAAGWPQRPVKLSLPGWQWDERRGLWLGPQNG